MRPRTQGAPARSRGWRGTPCCARKAGLAATTRRMVPSVCATSDESSSGLMRMPTSMPSSSRFTVRSCSRTLQRTFSWRCMKRTMAGATYMWPNSTGAVMTSCPAGSRASAFSAWSAASAASSTSRALDR
ncbi:hypothetical protein FQZ97_698280 [compost metagenome]